MLLQRFIGEQEDQDFAECALILIPGALGVIARYCNELIAALEAGIEALRMARGGYIAIVPAQAMVWMDGRLLSVNPRCVKFLWFIASMPIHLARSNPSF